MIFYDWFFCKTFAFRVYSHFASIKICRNLKFYTNVFFLRKEIQCLKSTFSANSRRFDSSERYNISKRHSLQKDCFHGILHCFRLEEVECKRLSLVNGETIRRMILCKCYLVLWARSFKYFNHRHKVFIELWFFNFKKVYFLLFEQSLYFDNEWFASPRKLANVRRASH